MGAAVKDVREVLEEVDPMQSAGTGQGVEDGTALRPGMAAEEQGVLPGEGDIAVDALNEVIVPGVVATRGDGFNAIPLVQEVVHGSAHLRFGRIPVRLCLHPEKGRFQFSEYRRGIFLPPSQVVFHGPTVLSYPVQMFLFV